MTARQHPGRPQAPATRPRPGSGPFPAQDGPDHGASPGADWDGQILRLLRDGLTNKAVARELPVPLTWVARVRAEHGIPHPPQATWQTRLDPHKGRQVRLLLAEGYISAEVARRTGVSWRTVERIRDDGGFGPATIPWSRSSNRNRLGTLLTEPGNRSLIERWAASLQPVDGGHLVWTGRKARRGTRTFPILRSMTRNILPRRLSFEWATGRAPVGNVSAECGLAECYAPAHLADGPGRAANRLAASGRNAPPAQCPRGHDQTVHGRIGPTGRAYCNTCMAGSRRPHALREKGTNPA